jgi:hypothetical protein
MATAMLTSTPAKEKKKNSSPNKQNRTSVPGTLKVLKSFENVWIYLSSLAESKI